MINDIPMNTSRNLTNLSVLKTILCQVTTNTYNENTARKE